MALNEPTRFNAFPFSVLQAVVFIVCWTLSAVLWEPAAFSAGGECGQDDAYRSAREKMVAEQIVKRGISDAAVIKAMHRRPRHCFVPAGQRSHAYQDHPLPIGEGQTISQPYIVALMTESLDLESSDHVLEIGTGSGYQAAVLAAVVERVTTLEIKTQLHHTAGQRLAALGMNNIAAHHADGYFGWPETAAYDAIMITASVDHIPPPLLQQLKTGGRLVLPLGNPFSYQHLVLVTKHAQDVTVRQITGVLFVPMTGHALEMRGQ